jgi:hypothetical protein
VADVAVEHALNPDPSSTVSDIQRFAMDKLESLRDRDSVVELLRGNDVKRWPVASFSHRIRLAPLIIAHSGRHEEALRLGEIFLAESRDRDQITPGYSEYVKALRHRVAA